MNKNAVAVASYPQMLTSKDVAALLQVSKATLVRMIFDKSNPMPSVKIGTSRRFNYDLVQDWIAKQQKS